MSRLLINESPLQVLPTLAKEIGLNEAIILQQMHYWLNPDHNKNYINGRYWVYNSYYDWHKQFHFWSKDTIKRAITSLQKQQLVIVDNFNEDKFNHSKWYSINYENLDNIERASHRSVQNAPIEESNLPLSKQTGYTQRKEQNASMDEGNNHKSMDAPCNHQYKEQRLPTEITAENSSSRDFDEKKIANDMNNIWIEEIGEVEAKHLPEFLIPSMIISYQDIFNSSLDQWRTYCRQIASSQFLMGEKKGTNFKAKLSWAIKPESYERIQGGYYTLGDREIFSQDGSINSEEEEKIKELVNNSGKHPLWVEVCHHMLERVGGQTVKQWLLDLDITHHSQNEVYIHAPNRFVRDWVKKNLIDQLKQTLKSIINLDIQHIIIDIYKANTFGASPSPELEEERKTPPNYLSSSTPYPRNNSFQPKGTHHV